MEKLILKCGRFVPSASGSMEQRVARMEAYLGRLTEELEHLLGEDVLREKSSVRRRLSSMN